MHYLKLVMLKVLILFGTLATLCFGESSCPGFHTDKNASAEYQLQECLLMNYKTLVKPATEAGKPVQVNVSFYVVAVAQVYDTENSISLETYIEQRWYDERLTWNRSAYDNIQKLVISFWNIWQPELTVWDNRDSTGTIVEGRKAIVTYKGEVEWITQMRFSTYCWMDHAKFPFDKQICRFQFQHQVYDTSLVQMNIVYPSERRMPDGSCYSIHAEWKVADCHIEVEKTTWRDLTISYIALEIILDRQYSYHYYLIVVPSVLVVLFTLSLLWLPHDSNQRFSAAGAMLFLIVLTNFILQQFLPPGIGEVPVIASYLLYSIILLVIILTISTITYNLHSRDPKENEIPDILKKLLFNLVVVRATFANINPFISMPNASLENKAWNEPVQRGGDPYSPGAGGSGTSSFGQNTEKLLEDIRKHLLALANPSNRTVNEWKQLALIVDRLCFYIFFILNVIISTTIYAH